MGNIGKPDRVIEIEPLETPTSVPTPEKVPEPEPEKVPA